MLRSRKARLEEPVGAHVPEPIASRQGGIEPRVLTLTFAGGKIARIEVIGDPSHLRQLDLGVLDA